MAFDCISKVSNWFANLLNPTRKPKRKARTVPVSESGREHAPVTDRPPVVEKVTEIVYELDPALSSAKISNSFLKSQIYQKRKVSGGQAPSTLVMSETGQAFELPKTSIWIGREQMNDICLPDAESVQNTHAVIKPEASGVWIINKTSRELTKVNDQCISQKLRIYRGDEVQIGDIHFKAE